jgi:hypothetical protein
MTQDRGAERPRPRGLIAGAAAMLLIFCLLAAFWASALEARQGGEAEEALPSCGPTMPIIMSGLV